MERRQFATGGIIRGPQQPFRIERVGQCANGHCLYVFDGGTTPEHIVSAAEVKSGDTSKLTCPNEVAR